MRDDEFEFELSLFRIRVLHLWSMMLFYEILLFRTRNQSCWMCH